MTFTVELWLVHSYLLYKCYEHGKGESNFMTKCTSDHGQKIVKLRLFFFSSQLVVLKSASAVLICLIFTILVPLVCAEELHINPGNAPSTCPANTCYTLPELIENASELVYSNTAILFLPGQHNSSSSSVLYIHDLVNVSLAGVGYSRVKILCPEYSSGFVFANITNLTISNLEIEQCGTFTPYDFDMGTTEYIYLSTPTTAWLIDYLLLNTSAAVWLGNVYNLTVLDTSIIDAGDAGLVAINVFGSIFLNCSFRLNWPNCVFMFWDSWPTTEEEYLYSFHNCEIVQGYVDDGPFAAGLSMIFSQTEYRCRVSIENLFATENVGPLYSSLFFALEYCNREHISFRINGVNCSNNDGIAASIIVWEDNEVSCSNRRSFLGTHSFMNVSNAYFSKNSAALKLKSATIFPFDSTIRLVNVTMLNNSSPLTLYKVTAVVLEHVKVIGNGGVVMNIQRSYIIFEGTVTFKHNHGAYWSVSFFDNSNATFRGNTTFEHNVGFRAGAIYARHSILLFQGNVTFVKNYGNDGGAMALYKNSIIGLGEHAIIQFIENHAQRFGGALYVNEASDYLLVIDELRQIRCFFQPLNYSSTSGRVFFINNTAGYAGSDLYGGWGDLCMILDVFDGKLLNGNKFFNKIFTFTPNNVNHSAISSNPTRVCLCEAMIPECNITMHSISAYPGETIKLLAVSVGQRFGMVPSTVYAESEWNSKFEVPEVQHAQTTGRMCTTLTYTIRSASVSEMIDLLIDPEVNQIASSLDIKVNILLFALDPSLSLPFELLTVNVTLLPCPSGFVLDNGSCVCNHVLLQHGVNCSINSQRVYRKQPLWIMSTTEGVLIHEHCPYDYCKPESFDFSLSYPENQCAFHRSGLLCGACRVGLSQVFGTSNCKPCSNFWLLLIPVIVLAGVLLVVVLMMLNITVAVGTINGLVFYANIIKANEAIFIPPEATRSVLAVFIAWLNLDVGIEACFYDGLDAFVKTWLQFAFPLYIWLIVIFIIVSSHYSTNMARLSGRNAVPVLATLFLLSYTKLLRIIITAFSFTFLEYPNGETRMVWLYDASVDYLSGKHIALFLAALVVLFALSIPFTTILLFVQLIQTHSNHCVLRFCVPRVKPLIDAFTGPYKDKHRYWTGLLLLVRVVLFIVFSSNVSGDPAVNLLAIIVIVTYLLIHVSLFGRIYKKWFLIALEYSFLFNLVILSAATFYTRQSRGSQTVVVNVCIGAAAATFVAIVIFHICARSLPTVKKVTRNFKLRMNWRNNRDKLANIELREIDTIENDNAVPTRGQEATLCLRFNEFREPVLEYCDT